MRDRNFIAQIDPCAVLAVIVPFAVYLLTLAPSVTFFDSGEFLTAIHSLGAAHSPGYPLFINYAKPFTYLPFGNIAFRVNIATALSAAVACYGVYLLVCRLVTAVDREASILQRRLVALAAALTFAFSPRLWLQSNHDKPYPLVAFLCAMIFYLILLWREKYRNGEDYPGYIYLGAFLSGLGFGGHQIMILMLPSFAFLILSQDWRLVTRVKELLLVLSFAAFGFISVHLHLPIRAMQNPLLNWGDPKTLTQFLWNFLRKGYPVDKPVRSLSLLWKQINAFSVPYEFTLLGLFLLLIGLLAYFRKLRHEIVSYAIAIAVFLLVIVGYFNTPDDLIFLTEEFFDPIYLLSAVFIGMGMFFLLRQILYTCGSLRSGGKPVRVAALALLFALPVTLCAGNYVENDQHENYIAYDYATNSLRSMPEGAVLFTWGDSGAFPLWYLQGVEKMREDLDILHTPHLVFTWYLDAFPKLFRYSMLRSLPLEFQPAEYVLKVAISEQIRNRPVYIDFSTRYSVGFEEFSMIQRGICYELIKSPSATTYPPDLAVWRLYNFRGINDDMFFRDLDTGKAILIYASAHMEAGETFLRLGRVQEAVRELRMAERIAPEMQGQVARILSGYGLR
ncbi:DUF2723 domain-containing protein [Geobacter sp. DSM 9736]|uniref:glycosyltransferase family 117 protein n=1 Tax=Geobacter sp. DSM 9736 TaxID=1277350 RepID=UPI000B5138F8|nr:DUF2723 domain-containing protein [Geobacter sp. DSM 9736]SNB45845.1 Protein of unknown function [Geobacter sp. DSM 9736]